MKGRCSCNSVKYELVSPLQDAYYCHCRDCQYLSGSPFHVLGIVERGSIVLISGGLTEYKHATQDGAEMTREFCTLCGTPLFVSSTQFPDIQMFTISSLDEPELIQPTFEIWTSSRVPWATIQPDISSFSQGALDGPSVEEPT